MTVNIRLSDFICANVEPILKDWEDFATTILPARDMGKADLRDHARQMLMDISDDLDSHQSDSEQAEKSRGRAPDEEDESWAEVHGEDRQSSGFTVMETVSEFRALRASVVAHWTRAHSLLFYSSEQVEDLTRFHEAIDQALAESLEQYETRTSMSSESRRSRGPGESRGPGGGPPGR